VRAYEKIAFVVGAREAISVDHHDSVSIAHGHGGLTKSVNIQHDCANLEAQVIPFLRLPPLDALALSSSLRRGGQGSVKPAFSLHSRPTFATQMLLSFSPHPSPLLLSLPSSTPACKPHARLRPVHASASAPPSPELLGKSALRRISEKLRSLGYLETGSETPTPAPNKSGDAPSPGEIFVPTPAQLPRHRVGSTIDPSWATGDGEAGSAARQRRRGRGRDASGSAASAPPSAAELALPRDELRRLQGIGIRVRKRLKVGKAGITEGIVNGIHERWRNAEVVKLRCEDVWAMNMRRTHEILEVSAPLLPVMLLLLAVNVHAPRKHWFSCCWPCISL